MKHNLRFFLSWVLGSVIMYALFYMWHGVFLNDFKKLSFPLTWLLIFTAVAYITISYVLYVVYESRPMKNIYNYFLRGIASGVFVGIIIFIVSTVVTISLSKNLSPKHLMLDCVWQIAEQTIGGLTFAALKAFVPDYAREEA
jgi:CDP-diglyceride synthetase